MLCQIISSAGAGHHRTHTYKWGHTHSHTFIISGQTFGGGRGNSQIRAFTQLHTRKHLMLNDLLVDLHTNIVCVLTHTEGQTFAHAGGHWCAHLQRQLWPHTFIHTGFAVTAMTGKPYAAFGCSTDWLWHIFIINLPADSLSNCYPSGAVQSQENLTELWLRVLDYWMEMVLSVGVETIISSRRWGFIGVV